VMREPIVISAPYDEDQSEFAYHWPSVEQRPLPTRSVVGMCDRAILATELGGQRQCNGRQTARGGIARGWRRRCERRPARRVVRLSTQRLKGVNAPAGDDKNKGDRCSEDDRRATCSRWLRCDPLRRRNRF
jgi:hypothetical protein